MKYHVLVVDDEETSFTFVKDMLSMVREDEFELEWESDFNGAVAKLTAGKHDVCLLDYNLGGYTGFDLLQYAGGADVRVPVILMTGHGSHELDRDALDAGIADYLDKTLLKPSIVSRAIRYSVRQRQARNELSDLYEQVSELEQLKTDMIRIAAHDLRTPLMTMLNYAQFLERDTDHPLQDYQLGYAQEIVRGVRNMERIISDILSLDRIQATSADRYQQDADLTDIVRASVDDLPLVGRQLSLDVNTPGAPVVVRGDPAHLREATTNLIYNAVKYTPDGGAITVTLWVEAEEAVFSVVDTGYGIPQDMQARLFQPFYRAKSKETRNIEGTGLGLHLVRNIVRRHSGEIIFESVQGEGSTFGFRLPLKPR